MAETFERRLSAILSADVVGYSRLMAVDEERTVRALTVCRNDIQRLVGESRGRIVDNPGDCILAEFPSATDAVRAAQAIQTALAERNSDVPVDQRMEFRIGIHLGEVIVEGEEIYGDGVNIAARLEALAAHGGVNVSRAVKDQAARNLGLNYEDLGEKSLKNIPEPVHVYAVKPASSGADGALPEKVDGARGTVARLGWRRRTVAAIAVALVAAAAWLVSSEGDPPADISPDTAASASEPSLAVLPFANMSDDPEQEYFADGITEDLITDLSKVSALLVIARNSVFAYKGKAVKIEKVAAELGVRYILEGSVRKAGGRVRITAQLLDGTNGHHLWAERYDRELTDIFTVQDEVTKRIVTALELRLSEAEHRRLTQVPTRNIEAYDYFLRGQAYLNRYAKDSIQPARELFAGALELDPEFALAYASLAMTYVGAWAIEWSTSPDVLERATELVGKALELGGDDSRVHSLASLIYGMTRHYEQGIAEAERALELNPNDSGAYIALGSIMNHLGRSDEAVEFLAKALRLDPHARPIAFFHIGIAYQALGRDEESIIAMRRCLEAAPEMASAHLHLAVSYLRTGQEEAARAEVAEVRRLQPGFSVAEFRERIPAQATDRLDRFADDLRKLGLS